MKQKSWVSLDPHVDNGRKKSFSSKIKLKLQRKKENWSIFQTRASDLLVEDEVKYVIKSHGKSKI